MELKDALESGSVSIICNLPDLSGGQHVIVPEDELLVIIAKAQTIRDLQIAIAPYSYSPDQIDWPEIMTGSTTKYWESVESQRQQQQELI